MWVNAQLPTIIRINGIVYISNTMCVIKKFDPLKTFKLFIVLNWPTELHYILASNALCQYNTYVVVSKL